MDSLKSAMDIKEEYTICSKEDDKGCIIDLRYIEQIGDSDVLTSVLMSGELNWKLTKIKDLYGDFIENDLEEGDEAKLKHLDQPAQKDKEKIDKD